MNCDDVFDCLTDSRHGHAPELEQHLSHCPRCRQLREVLSPALALFDGTDPPREPGCEPRIALRAGAAPLLTPEAVQLAQRTARELGLPISARRPARRWATWTASAAGLLVGCLLTSAAAWWYAATPAAPSRSAAVPLMADHCLWPAAASSDEAAAPRSVILSCVACHLDGPLQ